MRCPLTQHLSYCPGKFSWPHSRWFLPSSPFRIYKRARRALFVHLFLIHPLSMSSLSLGGIPTSTVIFVNRSCFSTATTLHSRELRPSVSIVFNIWAILLNLQGKIINCHQHLEYSWGTGGSSKLEGELSERGCSKALPLRIVVVIFVSFVMDHPAFSDYAVRTRDGHSSVIHPMEIRPVKGIWLNWF